MKLAAQSLGKMEKNAEAAEQLLKSLANANRLKVLCYLVDGERTVGELEQQLELSQSALSQHLARLREQGIVTCRKDGTTVYYKLVSEPAKQIMQLLYNVYCSS